MNQKNTVIVTVSAILLCLGLIGGTYAWFSTQVNGLGNDVIITTANLGKVVFTDGQVIEANDIYPGESKSKTFTVVSENSTVDDVEYEIILKVIENTI